MKNLSVRVKMILLALITLVGTLAIVFLAETNISEMEKDSEMVLRASIESDYDENIKNQVDCAISLLNEVYEGYERGEYSLDKAKEMGASLLRDLRYGDGGYFWADTYEGVNVVLLGSTTEGTNRMDAKDINGNSYMKDIISAGRNPDGGYADYVFPKAGETEPSPKRAYSKSFEPFEWVIGTGNYIDYIDTTVAHETQAVKANARSAMNKIAGMEETAASSDTVKSMANEIEGAAKNIATRSQEGAQQAADIHKRASEAQTTARKQREHVAEVHRSIREGLTKALEDAGVVKQIEVLSSSIMEITSQTNLLALNASIEAARAGDAGRGFAVVATEIGGLAEQSKEAVVKIQQVTEAVTASVERLSEDAGQLLEFVGGDVVASYDMFDKVVDAYNQDAKYIDMLIGDFSATSEELLASIDGVLSSMDGIATATNEGAKGTTDIAQKTIDVKAEADSVTAEVERCDETAKKLMEEIGVFKI